MVSGLVFNIQRFSVHDGPGIRTTVFLKGCPLRCLWCHNPEGINPHREIIIIETRCIGCGKCIEVCPVCSENVNKTVHAKITKSTLIAQHIDGCQLCGECVKNCPAEARMIAGTEYTATELVKELLKDRMFFEESNGGVTFSGGEPLMQPEFVMETISILKKQEVHVAIDTCGFSPHDTIRKIAGYVDLILFDLKFISPGKHRKYTGVSNELIIENLAILDKAKKDIWIRIPLIPGVNTNESEIEAIIKFLKPLHSIRQINLLPYHKTGIHKAHRISGNLKFSEFEVPGPEQLELIKSRLSSLNIPVKIGG